MPKKRPAPDLISLDDLVDANDYSHLHISQTSRSSRWARTNIQTIPASSIPLSHNPVAEPPITWDCLPSTKTTLASWNEAFDLGEDLLSQKITSGFIETVDDPTEENDEENKSRKSYVSDDPILQWIPLIDEYVSEFLRQEALDKNCTKCFSCQLTGVPLLRCADCRKECVFCQACIVQLHSYNPFHWIQEWNGVYFEKRSLKSLGLRMQLGHPLGERCLVPDSRFADRFVVIDCNGIHSVAVDFCNCHLAQLRHVQLLRASLFPATVTEPTTAATFQVLHHFQLLSFMSKIPAFDYYHTLSRCSDNTGLINIPDRYRAFLRIVREWRHVRLLKRMGRGHSSLGISSVSGNPQGGCALICPTCPEPGINVSADCNELNSWIYTLYVGLDANFRLKCLNVSNSQRDPCLNQGSAYVVDPTAFSSHLSMFGNLPDDDITGECNNHDAIKSASIRGSKGTAASGAGTVECIRHDFKRPCSIGDLQKGEQYINMDYFFLSSVGYNPPPNLLVSYDIACQWHRKLLNRCQNYPSELTNGFLSCIPRYAINKMHINAHRQQCQVTFSLNLMPYVGRTDGEAPERGWAAINAIANSMKEMGPGSRNDTLDDHFGDQNWRKMVGMCIAYIRKVKEAAEHQSEQLAAYKEFTASLDTSSVELWLDAVTKWERDPSQPNPFYSSEKKVSEHAVRLELAEEEEKALRDGLANKLHNDISGSMMLSQGLELESQQYKLKCDISKLGKHSTELQRTKIVERKNAMKRKIDAWIDIQQLYMPAVALLRGKEDHEDVGKSAEVTETMLLLPSQVAERVRVHKHLQKSEIRLRQAQCHDLLAEIRRQLHLRTKLFKSKDRFAHGPAMQTRSHTLIEAVDERIVFESERYRHCYKRLVALSISLNEESWKQGLNELHDDDVRSLDAAQSQGITEGRRTMSWIWMTGRTFGNGEQEIMKSLRIEWCKARTRAHRWAEECILLREEMRRVLATLEWQANWWASHADYNSSSTDLKDIGRHAYAMRQAQIRRDMRVHFASKWEDTFATLDKVDLSLVST